MRQATQRRKDTEPDPWVIIFLDEVSGFGYTSESWQTVFAFVKKGAGGTQLHEAFSDLCRISRIFANSCPDEMLFKLMITFTWVDYNTGCPFSF